MIFSTISHKNQLVRRARHHFEPFWSENGDANVEACAYLVHERDDLKDQLVLPQVIAVFEDDGVHGSILGLEDQLGRHQRALEKHPRSSRSRIKSNGPFRGDVVRYLKEGGGLGHDACDLDLGLQGERDGLELRKVHLLVVGQQGLQPLRLRRARKETLAFNVQAHTCRMNWKRVPGDVLQQTFFFRFPLSLCTAFISCTSLFTKVSWEANSDRMILTLLSPWRGMGGVGIKTGRNGPTGRLVCGETGPPATGPDLQQSLAEPHHDVQVHLSLRVSLLGVLVLALHNHVPEAAAQRVDARPEYNHAFLNCTHQYK